MNYKILVNKKLLPDNIKTIFSPSKRKMNKEIGRIIEQNWSLKVRDCQSKGIKIWNGKIKCLNDFSFDGGRLVLNLGETTFKEVIGTHASENNVCEKFGEEFCSKGIYVAGAPLTKDGYIVFGRRKKYRDAGGKINAIGGMLDEDWPINNSEGLFRAIEGELVEELGIDQKMIQDTKFIGLVRTIRGKYAFYFLIKLSADRDKIKNAFEISGNDEHDKLIFCRNTPEDIHIFYENNKNNSTSCIEIVFRLLGYKVGD